ncbi:MAG: DEAD/DEAH box helicase [Pseudomonadota bacterium]
MLPAHLAENIRRQVLYYLQSTFAFRDRRVEQALARFMEDPDSGLFKGPWVHPRRPYRPAPEGADIPFDFQVPFHPFRHQWRAWQRLSPGAGPPASTIITTGTGSGKTECFLYPILDHCLREKRKGRQGVKAIILYPMNALAGDQEKRFAKTAWTTPELKQAGIRVGNYTGRYDPADPGAGRDSGTRLMGETHGITNHQAQLEYPPDILLTNYKMLDFLLMRPQDRNLWRHNEPGTLKYLVLDELHTYDGAQGADVACLIRRLKERLDIPRGKLCVVGTSATLESREAGLPDGAETGSERLARFAETLFEETIPIEAVIGEDRLEVEEIVHSDQEDPVMPDPRECAPREGEDAVRYTRRQAGAWGGPTLGESDDPTWSLAVGEWLKKQKLFKSLLEVFHRAELEKRDPVTWRDLVLKLSQADLEFNAWPKFQDRELLAASFFALAAQAKETRSGAAFPLAPTSVQLWIRELRRLGRVVVEQPVFSWLDEPAAGTRSLPAFHCGECGESGWIALHDPAKDVYIESQGVHGLQLNDDPQAIYRAWFGRRGQKSQYLVVISPRDREENEAPSGQDDLLDLDYLCQASLVLRRGDGPCPLTQDGRRFKVRVNRDHRRNEQGLVLGDQGCPRCGSKVGVFFIGSQSATLASLAIDELFGSILNGDPKLLAFTDSVQDASHRAGFFTARTYHFTFRTALQHLIDEAGPAGLPLTEVGKRLLTYWAEEKPGRPGRAKEAMAALIPPDLRQYQPYLDFRDNPAANKPPRELLEQIETRLAWEAVSEFGVMLTHGRTMESSGSACVGYDREIVEKTVAALRDRLPGVDPSLLDIEPHNWTLWLHGLLHRYRERGALDHPYLKSYARQNFWGKYPFGRAVSGRETYPPALRYRPSLVVTQPQRDHEFILSPTRGGRTPWPIVWSRRALGRPQADESSLLDLLRAVLELGAQTGLFVKLHQDGDKDYFAISAQAAVLHSDCAHLASSQGNRSLIRPALEAWLWLDAPSLDYYAPEGRYRPAPFTPRQQYYQDRYRKGALRRVVACEHTGLLATEEREKLESDFAAMAHFDDPNVLTCTSTLEMGIDIGDLSSTMLCSIPPSTASYLQRIGRAGRATGTALIVSVVNQRPHDLFFFARPLDMIKGRVEPPGCRLDASAVLARQYLGYCFDSAVKNGRLENLPRSASQLVTDLNNPDGLIPRLMNWVVASERELQGLFLGRFKDHVQDDTRERFRKEADADLLIQRIHQAANEFDRARRDLINAQSRLRDQLKALGEEEKEAQQDIQAELKVLQGRAAGLNRVNALELLTDHGLLPNYAFPERGVRFHGAVYNKHRGGQRDHKPISLVRPAGAALRELAPGNFFYTHSRQFEIQQLAIGNSQQPLVETWGICGVCGHMRRVEDIRRPDAPEACPQCGHGGDHKSQLDQGQQKQFIEFAQSQAISYMEYYESLSADRSEERQREFYQRLRCYDQTVEAPSGAVGDDKLPFGIEYRATMVMREVNVGYHNEPTAVYFGPGQKAPEKGFSICKHCGVAVTSNTLAAEVEHRRSCPARRRFEKMRQEGKTGNPFEWEQVYLYRELRSEAIRLLLPLTDDEDVDTLTACLYLGLRLRFEGNPAYLIISPQIIPDPAANIEKHYLVLMDAVPGGTGYLKTLYQEKDEQGREGQGVMDVLRLARDALEACACRKARQKEDDLDTDGCYRCIRAYHLQYNAEKISRERGIGLLNRLLEAGGKRVQKTALDDIKTDSLFGSVLEKKFVDRLREVVEKARGHWEPTIIRGGQGFRFRLPGADFIWELELQPKLGPAQGVTIPSQPDFLLSCDADRVKPAAVFTDGFEFHCDPHNRLADDISKRRAIRDSGNYWVWNLTWDDLVTDKADHHMVCNSTIAQYLEKYTLPAPGVRRFPEARLAVRNGFEQLRAYLMHPYPDGWAALANFVAFLPLNMLLGQRRVRWPDISDRLVVWKRGPAFAGLEHVEGGDWLYSDQISLTRDFVAYTRVNDVLDKRQTQVIVLGRLGDSPEEVSGSDFRERWRRFLACVNLYQFCDNIKIWSASEAVAGEAPDLPQASVEELPGEWAEVLENVTPSLKPFISEFAAAGLPTPRVEYFNEHINDDAFAELAWPNLDAPTAILAGDQESFASQWQRQGWKVVVLDDLTVKKTGWLAGLITPAGKGA